LREAVAEYRRARDAWVETIEHGRAYREDVTVGGEPWLRGHWADRLPVIEADLADVEAELECAQAGPAPVGSSRDAGSGVIAAAGRGGAGASVTSRGSAVATAPLAALDEPPPAVEYAHAPPAQFERGQALPIELGVREPADTGPISVRLHYRHLNQAEEYEVAEMAAEAGRYRATIPAAYTDSPYPLLYYFELRAGPARAWLYPGLADDLANRAYFVIRQT
ncbi:MAG: hypothetical protein M3O34_19755, partial [Chloroflexota bacterium]|nr:hypothetical protein [Chloroflexota bacterium]